MKRIIKILAVIAALLLIGYLVVTNLPKASVKSKTAVATFSATDIYDAFSTDESKAEKEYIGKVLVINGTVSEIYDDENGAPVVMLSGNGEAPAALVTMEKNQKSKLAIYKEGDDISIKAACTGMLMEVSFNKGIVQ